MTAVKEKARKLQLTVTTTVAPGVTDSRAIQLVNKLLRGETDAHAAVTAAGIKLANARIPKEETAEAPAPT